MINWLKKNQAKIKIVLVIIFTLFIISLVLIFWLPLSYSFRIVFGGTAILFLPGIFLSFIFFPITKTDEKENQAERLVRRDLDYIERIIISPILSFAIIIFILKVLQYLNIYLDSSRIFLTIIFVILFVILMLSLITWRKKAKTSKAP